MRSKTCSTSKPKNIFGKIKNVFEWICFVIAALFFIAIPIQLIYLTAIRNQIKQDPVRTEATVTNLGEPFGYTHWTIYYKYQVNDSIFKGKYAGGRKKKDCPCVGQAVAIVYARSNPANSMVLGEEINI